MKKWGATGYHIHWKKNKTRDTNEVGLIPICVTRISEERTETSNMLANLHTAVCYSIIVGLVSVKEICPCWNWKYGEVVVQ
jgi:biotin synthase-like enzyme